MANIATEKNNIYQKLAGVQINLKAPKSKTNSFGKYNYRSCEDILEAVKPLLNKAGLVLVIDDSIEFIEGRFYIKAKATLFNTDDGDEISATAYAREADSKTGMDAAQLTGACSSYARKYALNALFAIDDTKDVDTDEHAAETQARAKATTTKKTATKGEPKAAPAPAPATAAVIDDFPERKQLRELIRNCSLDGHMIANVCKLGPTSTAADYKKALAYARKLAEEQARAAYAEKLVEEALDLGVPEEPAYDPQSEA